MSELMRLKELHNTCIAQILDLRMKLNHTDPVKNNKLYIDLLGQSVVSASMLEGIRISMENIANLSLNKVNLR